MAMVNPVDPFAPGERVEVTQQIAQRDRVWTTRVTGTVVKFEQRKTGSWYAHSKDDKLWLDRLTLRKDDGEIVVCNLDPYTHVEALEEPAQPPGRAVSGTIAGQTSGAPAGEEEAGAPDRPSAGKAV